MESSEIPTLLMNKYKNILIINQLPSVGWLNGLRQAPVHLFVPVPFGRH